MWSRNALSERLNLEWPILQAPMGDVSTPALASAVSNAGGLGGLGMWGFSAEEAARRIAGFRQQSGGSLNVNYPLWDDPGDLTNVGVPMRARLQKLYDEASLGELPEPTAAGSTVAPDHVAMLLESNTSEPTNRLSIRHCEEAKPTALRVASRSGAKQSSRACGPGSPRRLRRLAMTPVDVAAKVNSKARWYKPEVVSFHFGLPALEIVEAIKSAGIVILCSATSLNKVRHAQNID